jgi:hypothetical protein
MKARIAVMLSLFGLALAGCSKQPLTGPDPPQARLDESSAQITGASNPGVAPPNSKPRGISYSEWSVRWWQWAYGLPVTDHPLFDETGVNAARGQSGQVWFLGGVFNVSGTATREITVPSGKALFFPIINFEADNFWPPIDPPLDAAGLAALAASFMDGATDLAAELDGRSITNLTAYRTKSKPFSVTLPAGNIPDFFGFPTPAGNYAPLVGDGFYLFLNPLSVGDHRLHFHGSLPDFNFELDITYLIHVKPGNGGGGRGGLN